MGETISHEKLQNDCDHGTIVTTARRIHHILSNGGSEDNLLCDFLHNNEGTWQSIMSTEMRTAVQLGVTELGLQEHGIDPDLVGVHSLQAGSAMALKLQGVPETTIKNRVDECP